MTLARTAIDRYTDTIGTYDPDTGITLIDMIVDMPDLSAHLVDGPDIEIHFDDGSYVASDGTDHES